MNKKTITDDYGNLIYKTKKGNVSAGSLGAAKHRLRRQRKKESVILTKQFPSAKPSDVKKIVKTKNHLAAAKNTTGKVKFLHRVKGKIHANNLSFPSRDGVHRTTPALVRIAKRIRK
jgi:predicted CopG family antitoxin